VSDKLRTVVQAINLWGESGWEYQRKAELLKINW